MTHSPKNLAEIHATLLHPCTTPDELHTWIRTFCQLDIPRTPVCPHHHAPFDYLCSTYFEPASDLIVWAPRGGGKTRLGALATLLDLLHKPSCQIRILGGSLEQSQKMWEHLLPDLEPYLDLLSSPLPKSRRLTLPNRSSCAILTQSQKSVRGLRVQKLRCDEVELFDPQVWSAAQLTTRSCQAQGFSPGSPLSPSPGTPGEGRGEGSAQPPLNPLGPSHSRAAGVSPASPLHISGTLEAISTLHTPFGLMNRILDEAESKGTRILKWCLLEVLEPCPPERDCNTCPLFEECQGRAKLKTSGYLPIDDAITLKRRSSTESWQAEMLCQRPNIRDSVFPTFDPATHVTPTPPLTSNSQLTTSNFSLSLDFGFSSPFVCLWIQSTPDGHTYVLDEYVQPQRTIADHLDHLESRPHRPRPTRITCDPAGSAHSDQTAASNVQYLRSRGYTVKHRKSLILDGLELIRFALKPALGPPRLFVHPRCTRLIQALRSYHYAPGGSELPLKDGTHDHLVDALRYHFVNAPSLKPPQPPRRY